MTSAHLFTKTLQWEGVLLYPEERSIFISKDKDPRRLQTDRVHFPQFTTMTSTPYPVLCLPNLHPLSSQHEYPRLFLWVFLFLMENPHVTQNMHQIHFRAFPLLIRLHFNFQIQTKHPQRIAETFPSQLLQMRCCSILFPPLSLSVCSPEVLQYCFRRCRLQLGWRLINT